MCHIRKNIFFPFLLNKTNQGVTDLLFYFCWITQTGWAEYPFLRNFVYLRNPRAPKGPGRSQNNSYTILPCINCADLIDQTSKTKLIIFLFIFSYIYVAFQSQHYQSYKILYIINKLSTPKYFILHKTRSIVDQSINIDKSTINQSINIYLYISMFTPLTLNAFNFPLSYPFKVQPS